MSAVRMCCPSCPGVVYDDDYYCPVHAVELEPCPAQEGAEQGTATARPPEPPGPPRETPAPPADTRAPVAGDGRAWDVTTCWSCGAPSHNPANAECLECTVPLVPPRLVLVVGTGTGRRDRVGLRPRQIAVLGREGEHARLFEGFPNVSGEHAAVGVDVDGAAWIVPLRSTNGTFSGEGASAVELAPHVRRTLSADDTLRLGLHATLTVALYAPPRT